MEYPLFPLAPVAPMYQDWICSQVDIHICTPAGQSLTWFRHDKKGMEYCQVFEPFRMHFAIRDRVETYLFSVYACTEIMVRYLGFLLGADVSKVIKQYVANGALTSPEPSDAFRTGEILSSKSFRGSAKIRRGGSWGANLLNRYL